MRAPGNRGPCQWDGCDRSPKRTGARIGINSVMRARPSQIVDRRQESANPAVAAIPMPVIHVGSAR